MKNPQKIIKKHAINHDISFNELHLALLNHTSNLKNKRGSAPITKKILKYVEQKSDFKIDIMETDKNHIHILIDISSKIAISSIVARIKKFSTYFIFKRHTKL